MPLRITSLFRPFADLIFSTEVPYFRAKPQSVSLPFTVTFTLPPELEDFFLEDEDEDDETFFTGVEFTRRVLLDEDERLAGGSSRSGCWRRW